MKERAERRINKIINPSEVDGENSLEITEMQRKLLRKWNTHLELNDIQKTTRSDYLKKASYFLKKTGKPVQEIDKEDIKAYLSAYKKSTRNNYKTTIRQFFLWYYLDYKEVSSPKKPRFIDSLLKVKGSSGRNKVKKEDLPREEEIKELMGKALNHRNRALIAILADKGMRIREALSLKIKHVNFDDAGIYLTVPSAKKDYEDFRKNRLTWSRSAFKDWIEAHPKSNDDEAFVFMRLKNNDETGHEGLTYSAARTMLERLKERSDVRENITFHKFRHYSTTKDRQKKHLRDSYIVKDKGWDDPSMLEKYDHLTEDTVDKAHIRQMVEDGQLDKSAIENLEDDEQNLDHKIELIKCPNCGLKNSPERDFCDQCNQPFNDEGISKQEKLEEAIREYVDEKGLMEKLDVD